MDGRVISGHSFVEQAAITGEPMPSEKFAGGDVYAGTINQAGMLQVVAERLGRYTTFGKIIEAIEKAERSRAPIQKMADRLAGYRVYFALGAALLTFLITHNLCSTISVIIVAGACGIAAGTPLALLGRHRTRGAQGLHRQGRHLLGGARAARHGFPRQGWNAHLRQPADLGASSGRRRVGTGSALGRRQRRKELRTPTRPSYRPLCGAARCPGRGARILRISHRTGSHRSSPKRAHRRRQSCFVPGAWHSSARGETHARGNGGSGRVWWPVRRLDHGNGPAAAQFRASSESAHQDGH